jgi:hypothetical protein
VCQAFVRCLGNNVDKEFRQSELALSMLVGKLREKVTKCVSRCEAKPKSGNLKDNA